MSEITLTGTLVKGCTHCGGDLVVVMPRALSAFRRCASCGRDDRTLDVPKSELPSPRHPLRDSADAAPSAAAVKCKVDGCPGVVLSGRCQCCENRAKYLEERAPKVPCGICRGLISSKYGRKFCDVCAPIAKRDVVAKAKSKMKGRE